MPKPFPQPLTKGHLVLYICAAVLVLGIVSLITLLILNPVSEKATQAKEATAASTTPAVEVTTIHFMFEVASTTAEQTLGLGGRTDIPHDYGMLFVFPKDDTYGFWMKDMKTSIDMLWLSDTGKVVYEMENVSPDTYPTVFYPTSPARYVLETRAGEAAIRGWSVGSDVPLPLPYGK